MSQNVAQWLAEIQSLQRQVTMLQQEREQAYNSVKSWRDLYEGEAKQRQREAKAHSRKLAQLEKTLQSLQPPEGSDGEALPSSSGTGDYSQMDHDQTRGFEPTINSPRLEAEIAAIKSVQSAAQLQAQLITAKKQCEQLKHQLKAEQNEHEQTRESLTAALGDAVNLLAKERTASSE